VRYLMLYNKDGEPIKYARLESGEYWEIAGKLENLPLGYAYHNVVDRDEVARHFELDEDD